MSVGMVSAFHLLETIILKDCQNPVPAPTFGEKSLEIVKKLVYFGSCVRVGGGVSNGLGYVGCHRNVSLVMKNRVYNVLVRRVSPYY